MGAPSAHADQGLDIADSVLFDVDLDAGRVKASEHVTLTNSHPNSGGYYYFFTSYYFYVPTGADAVTVTSNGAKLPLTSSSTKYEGFNKVTATFPALRYGNSRKLALTYSLSKADFRSSDSYRVGKGFASFPISAYADPGRLKVHVTGPAKATMNTSSDFDKTTKNGRATWTADLDQGATDYSTQVALTIPGAGAERKVSIHDKPVTIEAFPGDKKWLDFVSGFAPDAVETLEDLAGSPLPTEVNRIREDVGIMAEGYAGEFVAEDATILLGEDLDKDTLAHEFAHAWVSGENCDGRWISEGLAQDMARRTLAKLGDKVDRPTASRNAKNAMALNSWGWEATWSEDDYAYAAADQVMRELFADFDDAQYAAAISAISEHRVPYPSASYTAHGDDYTYKALLDLVETVGPPVKPGADGMTPGAKTLEKWVLTDKQVSQVDWATRAKARADYREFDASDGAWQPPAWIRSGMAKWNFDDAEDGMATLSATAADAATVDRLATAHGWPVDKFKGLYEDASSKSDVKDLPAAMTSAAQAASTMDAAEQQAGNGAAVTQLAGQLTGYRSQIDAAVNALQDRRPDAALTYANEASSRAAMVVPVTVAMVAVPLALVAGLAFFLVPRLRKRAKAASEVQLVGAMPLAAQQQYPQPSDQQPDAAASGYPAPQYPAPQYPAPQYPAPGAAQHPPLQHPAPDTAPYPAHESARAPEGPAQDQPGTTSNEASSAQVESPPMPTS